MYTSLIIMAHTQHSHQAVTLSVRIQPEARDQLEILAHATGRTKSFLAAEAIEHYLSIQAWQINGINKSIKNADGKDAFIEHEQVLSWLASWGDNNEQEPPK